MKSLRTLFPQPGFLELLKGLCLLRSPGRMMMKYYCLLSTYYVPGTFHSNIQNFLLRQDSYFLRLKEVK